ncbi:hypothetical protein [Anaerocolumna sp. MB42-C2]|uniref:hypothetical protein n=1 Tax=Anaerocolumna sp. MB42-C2 TaxID=3070997 RepID=UPI0027E05D44|nr:hypothetical protein [Anaerocolumna sp. MB42-C2]WMJ90187.1 hypothetical protein RBU59_11870 [Anaerocolumna sp. MB42-C2]
MRKFQREQILELLQTLREANLELKKQTSPEVAKSLFGDVKEFTTSVVAFIDTNAGVRTQAAELLLTYSKTIASALVADNPNEFLSQLQRQLPPIEAAVRKLKVDKIEIAFFPYNLSMWDSLESIYFAAKSDPNCDVYCVPIPWFERDKNGRIINAHFDGDQYPKNIEISDWQKYDVEARHPDVIFIHNPYDAGNYVTTVHPDFYSKRLRNLTDLLVYVPYFVTGETIPEHFASCNACLYAHKVIVENEKVLKTYISAYKKEVGNHFGKPEEKFVSLGSPKYDAMAHTAEEYELSQEWHNVLYNADGSKKKVVFYNTSISAALTDSETYLDKLRSVIETFKHLDDSVLWWRPHPLLSATFKSMRPKLSVEYEQIVSDYKQYCQQ